ncbi:MAG: cytochrome C [Microcoleaceae cyanobacterium]
MLRFNRPRRRFPWRIWCGLIVFVIWIAGNLAQAQTSELTQRPSDWQLTQNFTADIPGTVDWVPERYQLGQQIYLENCSTCHVPVPPQVLPTQTWQQLLQDTQHYGVQVKPLVDPSRALVWNYLQTFSRSLTERENRIPYRLNRSRFFTALHPKVDFSNNVKLAGCVTCHPGAEKYNYRRLSEDWQEAP